MTTLYLICCTMRSGSTLLEFMLKDAGVGNAREYLHGNQPGFESYKLYARRIINGNRKRDVIGWRVMWGQLWDQQRKVPQVWEDVPVETLLDGIVDAIGADSVRYIYLTRRDHLRQAVSFVRAETSERWYCPPGDTPQPVAIPFTADIVQRVDFLKEEFPKYNRMWEDYFAERDIQPLRLVYEDITANDEAIRHTFWQMIEHIGAEVPSDYAVSIPLKKQAGQDVEQWIAQYQRNGHG